MVICTAKRYNKETTQLTQKGNASMSDPVADRNMARRLAALVRQQGGCAYYVGGCVRDLLLGLENKDIDMEIHGITPDCLAAILDSLGQRITIGESFGIFNLKGYSLDIAMPRKEAARGSGHRDFDVLVDPFIGTTAAARRRDFTINAMMQDVLTEEIVDPFSGAEDLKNGILRHVCSQSFAEDPLRVLRGAQFAARFNCRVAEETIDLCRGMSLASLPRERIEGELKKALLKADRPSLFFEVLRQMDQLDLWFPEVKALIGVPQNPRFHAEGDVWNHTMLVLDEAAKLRHRTENPLGFMLAALTHDFGKAVCTEQINGVIHSYDHETLGIPLAEGFLRRITAEGRLIRYVLNLVELHMKPNTLAAANASVKSTNHLFDRAVDPQALICIATADHLGRLTREPPVCYEDFLTARLVHYRSCMAAPCVTGKDILAAGYPPGEDFREILAYAHKLRLAGIPKDNALKQTLAYARTLQKKKRAP